MRILSFRPLFFFAFATALGKVLATGSEGPNDDIVVKISYQDLEQALGSKSNDHESCPPQLMTSVAEAFGPEGLGILEVVNIPTEITVLRQQVLEMAQQLAQLPSDELDRLTLPETMYTIGWSHGKEKYRNGHYDDSKGSFYFDPFRPRGNVFPNSLPLEDPALQVTHFMSQVGLWIAQLCDAYLQTDMVYPSLATSSNAKARLLYYFPPSSNTTDVEKESSAVSDDWCGWHKDHGSLTALLPGMIFGDNVDHKAGLYIRTRQGSEVQVKLPPTSLAIQVGETIEIMSGGALQATPHSVTAGTGGGGRASLALFLQPDGHQTLPHCPATADESLRQRHRSTFGAFQQATTEAFN